MDEREPLTSSDTAPNAPGGADSAGPVVPAEPATSSLPPAPRSAGQKVLDRLRGQRRRLTSLVVLAVAIGGAVWFLQRAPVEVQLRYGLARVVLPLGDRALERQDLVSLRATVTKDDAFVARSTFDFQRAGEARLPVPFETQPLKLNLPPGDYAVSFELVFADPQGQRFQAERHTTFAVGREAAPITVAVP